MVNHVIHCPSIVIHVTIYHHKKTKIAKLLLIDILNLSSEPIVLARKYW